VYVNGKTCTEGIEIEINVLKVMSRTEFQNLTMLEGTQELSLKGYKVTYILWYTFSKSKLYTIRKFTTKTF
jgi:hypothetical protein